MSKNHFLIVAGLMLVGCASPKPPDTELKAASGAIRAAQEVRAPEYPQAALHLKYAQESLAKAERFIAAERMDDARVMLARAKADAELALLLARVDSTRAEARRVAHEADIFEQEAVRRASR